MPTRRQTLFGVVLMLLGAALFVPPALPTVAGTPTYALVPGILLLTAGTYLIGTDVNGSPV